MLALTNLSLAAGVLVKVVRDFSFKFPASLDLVNVLVDTWFAVCKRLLGLVVAVVTHRGLQNVEPCRREGLTVVLVAKARLLRLQPLFEMRGNCLKQVVETLVLLQSGSALQLDVLDMAVFHDVDWSRPQRSFGQGQHEVSVVVADGHDKDKEEPKYPHHAGRVFESRLAQLYETLFPDDVATEPLRDDPSCGSLTGAMTSLTNVDAPSHLLEVTRVEGQLVGFGDEHRVQEGLPSRHVLRETDLLGVMKQRPTSVIKTFHVRP